MDPQDANALQHGQIKRISFYTTNQWPMKHGCLFMFDNTRSFECAFCHHDAVHIVILHLNKDNYNIACCHQHLFDCVKTQLLALHTICHIQDLYYLLINHLIDVMGSYVFRHVIDVSYNAIKPSLKNVTDNSQYIYYTCPFCVVKGSKNTTKHAEHSQVLIKQYDTIYIKSCQQGHKSGYSHIRLIKS